MTAAPSPAGPSPASLATCADEQPANHPTMTSQDALFMKRVGATLAPIWIPAKSRRGERRNRDARVAIAGKARESTCLGAYLPPVGAGSLGENGLVVSMGRGGEWAGCKNGLFVSMGRGRG